jgi:hypothetical protein
MASATVANTGTCTPSTSTVVPALRGFTPPTTCEPDATIRLVCLVPSEPVMPWTMILEFSVSQMAMSVSPSSLYLAARASGGALCGAVIVSTCSSSGRFASVRMRRPSSALFPSRAYDEWGG